MACTESECPTISQRFIPEIGQETGEDGVRRSQGENRRGLDWDAMPAPHAGPASFPFSGVLQVPEQNTSGPFCFSKRLAGGERAFPHPIVEVMVRSTGQI